jgi:hypothetical protein
MKKLSLESIQVQDPLEPALFVSLKDYFVGEEQAPNPYASIDDFLDEIWNVNLTTLKETESL